MLALLIALSAATTLAGAAVVTTEPAPTWTTTEPDLIITEMCPDTAGDGTGGWTDGKDVFEMFEIYNNSDFTLNLYDYCITYNGNNVTNDMYENAIVEITPSSPTTSGKISPATTLTAPLFSLRRIHTPYAIFPTFPRTPRPASSSPVNALSYGRFTASLITTSGTKARVCPLTTSAPSGRSPKM